MIRFSWLNFQQGEQFTKKAVEISNKLGITVDSLMDAIWLESEFNRNAENPKSGAYGLIQCLPSTLKSLGLTKLQVSRMTGTEQLERVVYPYLKPYQGRMKRHIDTYLAIFYPLAIGQPDNFIIAKSDEKAYRWNQILDMKYGDKDGRLEVYDVKCYANIRIMKAVKAHRTNPKYRNKIPQYYELNLS